MRCYIISSVSSAKVAYDYGIRGGKMFSVYIIKSDSFTQALPEKPRLMRQFELNFIVHDEFSRKGGF
jgi:hypothetical protein